MKLYRYSYPVQTFEMHESLALPRYLLARVRNDLVSLQSPLDVSITKYRKFRDVYVMQVTFVWLSSDEVDGSYISDAADGAILLMPNRVKVLYQTYDTISNVSFSRSAKSVRVDARSTYSGENKHYTQFYDLKGQRRS